MGRSGPKAPISRPCIDVWRHVEANAAQFLAGAHSMMVSVFPRLWRQEPYRDLGAAYFDERRRSYPGDRLAARIEH